MENFQGQPEDRKSSEEAMAESDSSKYPNLTSWVPGQSGNPTGKKQGTLNYSTRIKRLLEAKAASYPHIKDLARQLGLPEDADLFELSTLGQVIGSIKGKAECYRVIAEYFHEKKLDQNTNNKFKGRLDVNLDKESDAKAQEFLRKNGWGIEELLSPGEAAPDPSKHEG